VYRLDDTRALVVTTDFFTPIVDDAYDYGAIAAANALSDVYAMGGQPLLALNLTAFPSDLPIEMLTEVLRGSAEKVREAGAVIAGGHSIQDKEPKVGLAVVGLAHPDGLLTKGGARPGDVLVLTKPLGTGVISTAAKQDEAKEEAIAEAIDWMKRLNRTPAALAVELGARAATDITGYGFLGHATEMAQLSGVGLRVRLADVPLLSGARPCAEKWAFPGGSFANRMAYEAFARFEEGITEVEMMLLFDAQTSGGLLIALPPAQVDAFQEGMAAREEPCWVIGEVVAGEGVEIIR
jgi:selenide,water dikinase